MVKICADCGCEYDGYKTSKYCGSEECLKAAVRKRSQRYYRRHREEAILRAKKWQSEHREAFRFICKKYRWRKGL